MIDICTIIITFQYYLHAGIKTVIEVIGDAKREHFHKRTVGFYTRTRQRGTRIQVTQVLIFFCIIFFCCSLIMLYVAFAMFVYAEANKKKRYRKNKGKSYYLVQVLHVLSKKALLLIFFLWLATYNQSGIVAIMK